MQGLILIPDISGFTNFVSQTEIENGVIVTSQLLNTIIDSNPLDLLISEIEGDAILFYKLGSPIPVEEMFNGFQMMQESFDINFNQLKQQYNLKANLSLKFIVHYGNISVYNIRSFTKLYGQTVVEAHNLLKNGTTYFNYALITEAYFNAVPQTASDLLIQDVEFTTYTSNTPYDSRKINFYYFTNLKQSVQFLNKHYNTVFN